MQSYISSLIFFPNLDFKLIILLRVNLHSFALSLPFVLSTSISNGIISPFLTLVPFGIITLRHVVPLLINPHLCKLQDVLKEICF